MKVGAAENSDCSNCYVGFREMRSIFVTELRRFWPDLKVRGPTRFSLLVGIFFMSDKRNVTKSYSRRRKGSTWLSRNVQLVPRDQQPDSEYVFEFLCEPHCWQYLADLDLLDHRHFLFRSEGKVLLRQTKLCSCLFDGHGIFFDQIRFFNGLRQLLYWSMSMRWSNRGTARG